MKTAIKLVLIDLVANCCPCPDYDSLYYLFVSNHRKFG